jgi:hypothetical protein
MSLYYLTCQCGWTGHRTLPGGETHKCPGCGRVTIRSTLVTPGTKCVVETPAGGNVTWNWQKEGWIPC